MHTTTSNLLAVAAAATCGQGSDCRNNAHSVTNILRAVQKNILVHKSFTQVEEAGSIPLENNSAKDSTKTVKKTTPNMK